MIDSNSICSTLAILIVFSRYPSTAPCVVTATASDFTIVLRLVFAGNARGNAVLSPVQISFGSPVCIPGSVSVTDRNLLFGFGSGSTGTSLGSGAAGAADSDSSIAAAVLSLLFFLYSLLCIFSAKASLTTSFLRSNISALCGVILRHPSTRTLQRSEWPGALLLSLIALQPGHPTVAPNSSVSCLVILSLRIRAPSCGNGGIRIGSARISGLSTVHLPSVSLQGTLITLLMACLSHLL